MSAEISPNIFPGMRYQDAPAAIDWLAKAFGFEKQVVYPGPGDSIAHAQLRFGSGLIMLGSARDDELNVKSPRSLGGTSAAVYMYVEDVDAHYQRAVNAGAEVVRELADTPYGSREYTVRDPEGHVWSFGTYIPQRAAES